MLRVSTLRVQWENHKDYIKNLVNFFRGGTTSVLVMLVANVRGRYNVMVYLINLKKNVSCKSRCANAISYVTCEVSKLL